MERVTSYETLAPELNALLFGRACVNSIPDREALEAEIAAGELWVERKEEGLLLLQRSKDVQRIRFLLSDPMALCRLKPDRLTGVELPFRSGDGVFPALAAALEARGWNLAVHRIRMTRKPAPPPARPGSGMEFSSDPSAAAEVLELLYQTYRPATACLPTPEELESDLAEGCVLRCPGGMIRWHRKGKTSEMRHLVVRPAFRGRGLSKALITEYLIREAGRLSRVWTGVENAAAQGAFRSLGYAEDGWQSLVLLAGEG